MYIHCRILSAVEHISQSSRRVAAIERKMYSLGLKIGQYGSVGMITALTFAVEDVVSVRPCREFDATTAELPIVAQLWVIGRKHPSYS